MSERPHIEMANSNDSQSSTQPIVFDADSPSLNNSNSKVNNSNNTDTNNTTFGNIANQSVPTPRLFGQFNGTSSSTSSFGSSSSFGNLSSKERSTSDNSNFFANALGKLTSNYTSGGGGFSSTPSPLQSSLASLGANKPLFGSQQLTQTSFADVTAKSSLQLSPSSIDQTTPTNDNFDKRKNLTFESIREHSSSTVLNGELKVPQSLIESAAEYESKRSSGLTNIQGDTSTGEEDEITKFQMGGKLFVYNSEKQQFTERGYGILKINDRFDEQTNRYHSRLIMRLDKSFRVILNSTIVPKMTVERATDRSVRFGAQDDNVLRVFVIKGTSFDCSAFQSELKTRIQTIERLQLKEEQGNTRQQQITTTRNNEQNSFGDGLPDDSLLPIGIRKRSHSRSESDTSDNGGDLSKKSRIVQSVNNPENDDEQPSNNIDNDENDDEDSGHSCPKSEQESGDSVR
ncbi:unnamed protein product [Didymodactylos carnosus]|uniref:RanBD1 domain-containing protein n=1 Tax=Didymodactylos carnosus TaxID=1234261 RepID=A0A814I2Y5_9BILA|nr:unnamed protein product [Didymodactylos carnosus]CAF1018018.1 unnamed protein product [Didymodactylos carnosus]CAF3731609.1 unnamed protein product [Didymodactylos carnosus]CAF3789471.1 unnamed protein product [Didymodactylos carnosus]